jgi:hypothetical protein
VALAFEDIQGKLPTLPWQPDELQRALDAVAEPATTLTPAPVAAPSIATRLGEAFGGWQRLAAADEHGHDDLAGLDPWAHRHLDRLVALEGAICALSCWSVEPEVGFEPTTFRLRVGCQGKLLDTGMDYGKRRTVVPLGDRDQAECCNGRYRPQRDPRATDLRPPA